MLRFLALALAFTLGWVTLERPAAALSCDMTAPWSAYWDFEAVPVDVTPWMHVRCSPGPPEEEFGACTLVSGDHEVSITLETRGTENCDLSSDDWTYRYEREYLAVFVPDAALLPGRSYTLDCEAYGADLTLDTRASDAPASPPVEVDVTSALLAQGDDAGCCGGRGDVLELEVAEFAALPYLQEGGLIEATYPDGQVFWLVDRGRYFSGGADIILPPTDGPVELTPVAADGQRGPTTRLGPGDIRTQAVYIPCEISSGSPSLALWLLAPMLWIAAHGRRRRCG